MKYDIRNYLVQLVEKGLLDKSIKTKFLSRIQKGHLTRDENETSHLCVYFAAYDPGLKLIFIGHHIKSNLWLFNGGHIDKGESPAETLHREMKEEWNIVKKINDEIPSLFTITQIENPKKQTCKEHYDLWYFIPFNKNEFHPSEQCLSKEFFEWGWKTINEAKLLVRDRATLKGINFVENL